MKNAAQKVAQSFAAVNAQIVAANGNRRERTTTLADLLFSADVQEIANCEWDDAGRVANAYGYVAYTTGWVIRNHRGHHYIRVQENTAKGGTGFGTVMRRDRWIGPATSQQLKDAGFVALPSRKQVSAAIVDKDLDAATLDLIFSYFAASRPESQLAVLLSLTGFSMVEPMHDWLLENGCTVVVEWLLENELVAA